jgi:Uma2 family endonuclease
MTRTTTTIIGPSDHGRRMSLDEFDRAEGREGYLYELSRGVITVVDVPNPRHFKIVNATRRQFAAYDVAHPGQIYAIAGGSDCKLLIGGLESERHPDLAVYKTSPPDEEAGEDVWSLWVPEIVIEVVSPSSRQRDYEEKPEEYLRFGVREYWIIDAENQEVLVLRRSRGAWARRVIRPPDVYRTRLLPGFAFAPAAVFEAAGL